MSLTDEPYGRIGYREPLSQATGTVELVPITALRAGESPRLAGESPDHVRALAASEMPLPPTISLNSRTSRRKASVSVELDTRPLPPV